jgi:hypothetical protein
MAVFLAEVAVENHQPLIFDSFYAEFRLAQFCLLLFASEKS